MHCAGFWAGFCTARYSSFQEHLGSTFSETQKKELKKLVKETLQEFSQKTEPAPVQKNQGLGHPAKKPAAETGSFTTCANDQCGQVIQTAKEGLRCLVCGGWYHQGCLHHFGHSVLGRPCRGAIPETHRASVPSASPTSNSGTRNPSSSHSLQQATPVGAAERRYYVIWSPAAASGVWFARWGRLRSAFPSITGKRTVNEEAARNWLRSHNEHISSSQPLRTEADFPYDAAKG